MAQARLRISKRKGRIATRRFLFLKLDMDITTSGLSRGNGFCQPCG
jgi:hypothetical protein